MSISSDTLIHDVTVYIRDLLRDNITDPKQATRPSDSRFITTAYPSRSVFLPHIIVYQVGGNLIRLGVPNLLFTYSVVYTIDVLSKSMKECDELTDSVIKTLKDNANTLRDVGLYNMKIESITDNPVDEETHRKTIQVSFSTYA